MWMIGLAFLLLLAIVMFSVAIAVAVLRAHERKKVRGFLAQLDPRPSETVAPAVVVRDAHRAPLMNVETKRLVVLSLVLAVAGAAIGFVLRALVSQPAGSLLLAAMCGAIPAVRARRKRAARIKAFEAQFPDALEFLSRSMLAGHGFTSSLQLLTEEASDPLASIFRSASNEIQLGAPLETALGRIGEEIPLVDVRFFISAVLMQQASGGNLADIMNRLAFVVRERFRLAGEVRAASAHGRLTSIVLIALPVFLTIALLVMDPEYLVTFAHEPEGRFLLIAAVCGQVAGHVIIRRIVDIRV